jgi:hypothetical protein
MDIERAKIFRPVAAPQIIDNAYTEDQYQRLLDVVRHTGPHPLILAQTFKTAEEVIATCSGMVPEGVTPTLDMFLSPVFRGHLAHDGVGLYEELDDCYHNPKFLSLVRHYWGAKYAEPENYLFNIQGPSSGGGAPHVDGTAFRGMYYQNKTPVWLLSTMVKSGLFKRWQTKKAQVITWWYKGRIGGSFTYWPNGPHEQPKQLKAPMWNKAALVENEMMFHCAESCGPAAMRKPAGLALHSVMEADPAVSGGWLIRTDDTVIQQIPEQEFRFLVHWSANVYMDLEELKLAKDHSDDLTPDRVFDMLISDLKARGVQFAVPSDPMHDQAFIGLLTRVYDVGVPLHFPPEPVEVAMAS